MEKRFNQHKIEVRAKEGEPTVLVGYAAVFNSPSCDMWGIVEYVKRGAFARSLKENNQKALWNHNSDFVLGSTRAGTLKLWEDDKGLAFELTPPNTQAGKDAIESIRRGDVEGNSFGFQIKKQSWDETDPKNVKRYLEEVDLREISPTPFPAYEDTELGIRDAFKNREVVKVENYENTKRILDIMQMEV